MQIKNFLRTAALVLCAVLVTGCSSEKDKPLIIWTNISDFASYAESFNATHNSQKAIVVYKQYPAHSLPPAKDELAPDIVVGSWLKNTSTRKYFLPLDYLFSTSTVRKADMYEQLLDYGNIMGKQYLIPVSFNIPAMVYSQKNASLLPEQKNISLDEIKTIAGGYNQKNKSDVYVNMGYGPSWDNEFIYLVAKLKGAQFREKGTSFSWDSKAMISTISYVREWSTARNTDTTAEQNFQFKYLYMPKARQLASERCLFSCMTSDELFTLADDQIAGLDFKWIVQDNKLAVTDSITTMGIYKKTRNMKKAEVFLNWFMKNSTQEELVNRTEGMHLDSKHFGIAGGFSSLKSVNESIYPTHYSKLLGNVPDGSFLETPNILPYNWTQLKEKVILPYLTDSINTNSTLKVKSLDDRILEWNKQYF